MFANTAEPGPKSDEVLNLLAELASDARPGGYGPATEGACYFVGTSQSAAVYGPARSIARLRSRA